MQFTIRRSADGAQTTTHAQPDHRAAVRASGLLAPGHFIVVDQRTTVRFAVDRKGRIRELSRYVA